MINITRFKKSNYMDMGKRESERGRAREGDHWYWLVFFFVFAQGIH